MIEVNTAQIEEAFHLGVLVGQAPPRQDAYTWCAIYHNGTAISEFDRPEGRCFAEVEQSRVKELLLLPLEGGETYHMDIPLDAQPVFFRRRSIEIDPLAGESRSRPTAHCIGWKSDDTATYLFILPDGSTLLTNDLQAV